MNKPSGKLAFAYATIANLEEKISRLEAAQPAPVAVETVIHGSKLDEYDSVLDALDPESVCPYLSNSEVSELISTVRTLQLWQITRAAPVALVLPEHLQEILKSLDGSGTLDGYSFGDTHVSGRKFWWRNELRACLDELKRLNTARPVHANPPPGTEPSGTHIDNDGLDEWRKP